MRDTPKEGTKRGGCVTDNITNPGQQTQVAAAPRGNGLRPDFPTRGPTGTNATTNVRRRQEKRQV
ncbi:hypothetical protein GCM10023339_78930 [Alloalcanivorax gelatiniphagus]